MLRRLSPCLSSLLAALLWVGSANADPNPADRATARALAGEGFQALQLKDYATAADRFSRADALVHAPTLMLDWARSLVGLGQLVEAQERYQQVIREGVDPKAPKPWQRALVDARGELAALEPRLSWVMIKVSGASNPRVTIDGVTVPPAALGVRRAVNPGERKIEVTAPGYSSQHQSLKLAEGEETATTFELQAAPDRERPLPAVVHEKPTTEAPPATRNRTPAYVAFGVAGAGFVVGGVTGILALGKRSDLKRDCPDPNECAYPDRISAYHSLGFASGAGFAVGFAGAAAGLTLLLLENKTDAAPASGLAVRPYLGLGTVGARGSF